MKPCMEKNWSDQQKDIFDFFAKGLRQPRGPGARRHRQDDDHH